MKRYVINWVNMNVTKIPTKMRISDDNLRKSQQALRVVHRDDLHYLAPLDMCCCGKDHVSIKHIRIMWSIMETSSFIFNLEYWIDYIALNQI